MEALTKIFASNYGWKILAIILIIYILYKFLVKGKQILIGFKNTEFYYFLLGWKFAFQILIPSIGSSLPFADMLNQTYDNGYFPFNFLIVKYLFLYRPDYIQTVLSDSQNINKSKAYHGFKDWIGDSVFMRSDKAYTERKKLLLPAFRLKVFQSIIPIIEKNAIELVEVLTVKQKVFILPVVKQCGFNILYDTILGVKDCSTFREKCSYYEKLINLTFKPVLDRSINFLMSFDFLFYLTSKGREYKSNKEIIRIFTKEIIAEKIRLREDEENTIEINENPKSMLDFLLDVRGRNPELTIDSICQEIELFLGAAYETTALTVTWTLYLISQHEDIQSKIQQELDTIFKNDIDRFISNEDLHEMKYMECVIKETLRLYPPAPVISRKTKTSLKLGNKEFTKDWIYVISIFHVHRNPNVFKNPNVFDPERFLPENSSKRPPYSYIPFSAGPRMCLGYRLAMIEIKLILATILRKLKVGYVQATTSTKFRNTLNPGRKLQLKFKPRKS